MLVFTKAVGVMLTPPGIVILLVVVGLLVQRQWRRSGTALIGISVATLLALSLSITGNALLDGLEESAVPLANVEVAAQNADAIVVLGGGRAADEPQYGGDTVNSFTLERLRYAARLQRATGLPVLVSGGTVFGERVPEAVMMKQTLVQDFQVPVAWVESRSRSTYENAVYSRAILEAAGKKRIFLVTDAFHMPRALWAFHQVGIDAIMAPTGFTGGGERTLLDFLPSSHGLYLCGLALHERLGFMWYRLRYGASHGDAAATGSTPEADSRN